MRKSARDIKKPEVFAFPPRSSLANNISEEHDEDDDPETENEFQSETSDNIPTKSVSLKAVSRKQTQRAVSKKSKTKAATEGSEEEFEFSFFDLVASGRKVDNEIRKWVHYYVENKIGATVSIINFVLRAAGGNQGWIPLDCDLEALEPEEIDELLSQMVETMASGEGGKVYPLGAKQKKKSFREKYTSFWETFASKLLVISEESMKSKHTSGVEILRRLIDQLVSFSSIAIANIRDAVTEAALSIGKSLLLSCKELKGQIEIALRQMAAEDKNNARSNKKPNTKYAAYQKQKEASTKELEKLLELCNTLFNSIFAHRIKDSNEIVRMVCLQHVNEWVLFDVKRDIKVETLKYIGWACSDHSAVVRLAAIDALDELMQDQQIIGQLQSFVEHFVARFIEMACVDSDETVSLAMIDLLRVMQKGGLLDTVSELQLDLVDRLVFDSEVSAKIRQSALLFFFDHTEGFDNVDGKVDDLTENVPSRGSAKKRGKADALSIDDSKALKRRQQVSLQLETLTEFAEYHLKDDFEKAEMLAEACLHLPNFDILFDWSTIISLLLRESDDLLSSALRPAQVSILLRMLVTSAVHVCRRRSDHKKSSGLVEETKRLSISSSSLARQDQGHWEALNDNLQKSLSLLITRFRDDDSNLATLCMLLPCSDFALAQNQRSLKALLKVLIDIFKATQDRLIVQRVLAAMKGWMEGSGGIAGEVENAARGLLQTAWDSMLGATKSLAKVLKGEEDEPSSQSGSTRRRRSSRSISSDSTVQKEELFYSLVASICKFRQFWGLIDCRTFFDVGLEEVTDELVEVVEVVNSFADSLESEAFSFSHFEEMEGTLEHTCITAGKDAVSTLMILLTWLNRDAVSVAQSIYAKESPDKFLLKDVEASAEGPEEVGELRKELSTICDSVVSVRDKFVDVLLTLMAPEEGKSPEEGGEVRGSLSSFTVSLQREAFRLAADLRIMFPAKVKAYHDVAALAYSASQTLLGYMRKVFETEGRRIREVTANSKSAAQTDLAVRAFADEILIPLMQVLLADIEHLNRRQAASLVHYIADEHEVISEIVKHFIKRVKEVDYVKYLEIQMVALKGLFAELVGKPSQRRSQLRDDEETNEAEDEQAEAEGREEVDIFVKKLSASMGIAKLQDEPLAAMVNFFKAGLDFAFSERWNLGFVNCLFPYLRFLPNENLQSVAEYAAVLLETDFVSLAEDLEEARRIRDEEGEQSENDLSAVLDFLDKIRGTSDIRGQRLKRGRPLSSPSATASRKKKPAKAGGAGKKRPKLVTEAGETTATTRRRSSRGKPISQLDSVLEQNEEEDDEQNDLDADAEGDEVMDVAEDEQLEEAVIKATSESVPLEKSRFLRSTQSQSQSRSQSLPAKFKGNEQRAAYAIGLDIQDDDESEGQRKEDALKEREKLERADESSRNSLGLGFGTGATYSRKRPLSTSSLHQDPSQISAEVDDVDSLADLDTIPSRRRLRN